MGREYGDAGAAVSVIKIPRDKAPDREGDCLVEKLTTNAIPQMATGAGIALAPSKPEQKCGA